MDRIADWMIVHPVPSWLVAALIGLALGAPMVINVVRVEMARRQPSVTTVYDEPWCGPMVRVVHTDVLEPSMWRREIINPWPTMYPRCCRAWWLDRHASWAEVGSRAWFRGAEECAWNR